MKKIKLLTIIITTCLLSFNSFAMHDAGAAENRNHDTKLFSLESTKLKPNEIILEVHGVVCSFCSFGIEKKLSKLDFVDTKKFNKGSEINIENQTILISIKDGQKPDLEVIFESIRSGGYNPIKALLLNEDDDMISVTPNE